MAQAQKKIEQRKIVNLVTKDEQEIKEILSTIVQEDTILVITQDENDDLTIYSFRSSSPIQIIGVLDEAKQAFRNWWWNYKDMKINGEPI